MISMRSLPISEQKQRRNELEDGRMGREEGVETAGRMKSKQINSIKINY